jgi:hypothetical protein
MQSMKYGEPLLPEGFYKNKEWNMKFIGGEVIRIRICLVTGPLG